jgi:hypothetical protein
MSNFKKKAQWPPLLNLSERMGRAIADVKLQKKSPVASSTKLVRKDEPCDA